MEWKTECTRRGFLILAGKSAASLLLWGCGGVSPQTCYYFPGAPAEERPSGAMTGTSRRSDKNLLLEQSEERCIHEVAPMETVQRLAQTYGVPEEAILRANGLHPADPLQAGRKLLIPHPTQYKNIVPAYKNDRWKYIIIHHTAGEFGKALLVDQLHRERGFDAGLGYHFLVDNGTLEKGNGQVEVGPRWIKQEEGAHCKAGNMNSMGIGISLVGNFSGSLPSRPQMHTLVQLTGALCSYYRIDPANVLAHRQVPGAKTECPGRQFPWKAFMRDLSRTLSSPA